MHVRAAKPHAPSLAALRYIVVLDENNTVVHQEHIEDISTEPNYDAALRALGINSNED